MLYEVHDPSAYVTPDVTADFSSVIVSEAGTDRVPVSAAGGRPRPDNLKVTVAFDGGYLAEAEVSYAGPGAADRARLAADIIQERIQNVHRVDSPCRTDLVGLNALHETISGNTPDFRDVRLRAALRCTEREAAQALLWEVEALLCCGPAGGGGYRGRIEPSVLTYSTFLERKRVTTKVEVMCA